MAVLARTFTGSRDWASILATGGQLFITSQGKEPLFAPIAVATVQRQPDWGGGCHSLTMLRPMPHRHDPARKTEFSITTVYDPYGCAVTTDGSNGRPVISVYRRPLPTTSLRFLSAIMFDGRETVAPLNDENTFQANLVQDLKHQALDAVLIHAQAAHPPTDDQLSAIVNFELGLFTAQVSDDQAGALYHHYGQGGPLHLSSQPYYPGVNDSLGKDPHGKQFDPHVFNLYTRWLPPVTDAPSPSDDKGKVARAEIAAGEQLFNTAPLKITAVRGLNDNPDLGNPKVINGTCTTCHDTPGVGNHSLPLPLDIATSHFAANEQDPEIRAALAELSQPDVPIYLISGCPDPQNPGQTLQFYTSDPGKALVSGKCVDVNRIKGPILRGLAARAPYFHNGAAANLDEIVNFYNLRFQMNLTEQQKKQLVAFLNSL